MKNTTRVGAFSKDEPPRGPVTTALDSPAGSPKTASLEAAGSQKKKRKPRKAK